MTLIAIMRSKSVQHAILLNYSTDLIEDHDYLENVVVVV